MGIQELVASATFTILLGKNGAGKSTLLRTLDNGPQVKYVSPERGGTLKYDASVDSTMSNNQGWLKSTRLTNRFEQFRQQSAALFRNLELAILREIEKSKRGDLAYTFDGVLDQINGLLSAIKMVRSDAGFAIQSKAGGPVATTGTVRDRACGGVAAPAAAPVSLSFRLDNEAKNLKKSLKNNGLHRPSFSIAGDKARSRSKRTCRRSTRRLHLQLPVMRSTTMAMHLKLECYQWGGLDAGLFLVWMLSASWDFASSSSRM